MRILLYEHTNLEQRMPNLEQGILSTSTLENAFPTTSLENLEVVDRKDDVSDMKKEDFDTKDEGRDSTRVQDMLQGGLFEF